MQQLMSGGSTAPNAKETMLYRILTDEKRLGFGSEEEAAYLNLMLIQGAADTVRYPVEKNNRILLIHGAEQDVNHVVLGGHDDISGRPTQSSGGNWYVNQFYAPSYDY